MSPKMKYKRRSGAVLLVVLIIIMVITVLSLGFLSRSDVELACGRNMVLREQMDYLAESGIEHARGLILNPQDVEGDYFTGVDELQLVSSSNDYYDIYVTPDLTDKCNYTIDCNAYEYRDGEKVGQSNLRALLRLDPCVALWAGNNLALSGSMTIKGDVYCDGDIINLQNIEGDVFAHSISGTKSGQLYNTSDLSLKWPDITVDGYDDKPGVTYESGDYTLTSDIKGMLLVDGDLTIQDGLELDVTAAKNLPALFVSGNLIIGESSILNINGLAAVDGRILLDSGADINQNGGLFAKTGIYEIARDSSTSDAIASLHNGTERSLGQTGYNGALQFDGVDDYVEVENESLFDITNEITVAAWIKVSSFNKSFQAIVTKGDSSWRLQRYSNTNRIEFACSGLSNNIYGHTLSNTGIIDSQWHHVAGVYDGSVISIYIDGILDNNEPATGQINTNNYDVLIGNNAQQSNRNWYGYIDDIQIYNSALEPNDISIIKTGSTVSNLVAHWKFDETDSDISITAAPEKSAVILYDGIGGATKWGQAAGAFYKSIERR